MQVGDLVKPKCEHDSKRLGFAMISRINPLGRVVITWVDDQIDHYMTLGELKETMEIVCK